MCIGLVFALVLTSTILYGIYTEMPVLRWTQQVIVIEDKKCGWKEPYVYEAGAHWAGRKFVDGVLVKSVSWEEAGIEPPLSQKRALDIIVRVLLFPSWLLKTAWPSLWLFLFVLWCDIVLYLGVNAPYFEALRAGESLKVVDGPVINIRDSKNGQFLLDTRDGVLALLVLDIISIFLYSLSFLEDWLVRKYTQGREEAEIRLCCARLDDRIEAEFLGA